MERQFPKSITSLTDVFDFVSQTAMSEQLDSECVRLLHLAVEEVFVNLVKYNSESTNDVSIDITRKPDRLEIRLSDRDVHSYDPTKRPPVDIDRPIAERGPGGLGIHFMREIMDDVIYDYSDRTATITLIKKLE